MIARTKKDFVFTSIYYETLIFREQNIQTQLYNQDIFEGSGDFNFENIQKTEIVDKTGRLYY